MTLTEELVTALEQAIGALDALAKAKQVDPESTVRFTGRWEHHGTRTINEILDAADAALGRATTPST